MQTQDVMTTNVISVTPETSIREIAQLLLGHHLSALPVLDADGQPIGVVREGDLLHRVETGTEHHRSRWLAFLADPEQLAHDYVKSHGRRAGDVMSRDVVTVRPETPVDEVADLLEKHRVRSLPVLQDGKLVGMVSRTDLLRGLTARPGQSQAAASVDDETIRQRLWQAIRAAGMPIAGYVHVSVRKGVVELWGTVDSDEEKRALDIAAGSVPGVRAVEDHLTQIPAWAWAE